MSLLVEGLSPIPLRNVYHLGVVVPNLERGLAELGQQFGTEWAVTREITPTVRMVSGPATFELRYAYSRQGPPYLEVIEGRFGSFWTLDGGARLHHVGMFVEDLAKEVARLQAAGMTPELQGVGEDLTDERPNVFAFFNSAAGVRIELVDIARQAAMEEWIRG